MIDQRLLDSEPAIKALGLFQVFDLEHRVLLTGTPLQNNVEELFALLHFLEPRQFNSSEAFMSDFGNLKSEGQVDKLKEVRVERVLLCFMKRSILFL